MDNLPNELKWNIMLKMDLNTLNSLCMTDKTSVFASIWDNDLFWKQKLKHDFPHFEPLDDDINSARYKYVIASRYVQYLDWYRYDQDQDQDYPPIEFYEFYDLVTGSVKDLGIGHLDEDQYSAERWLKLYGQKRSLTQDERSLLLPRLKEYDYDFIDMYSDLKYKPKNKETFMEKYGFLDEVYNIPSRLRV